MGQQATFNPALFFQRYPEFSSLDPNYVALLFVDAGDFFANDGSGPCQDPNQQLRLMNALTAHLCAIYGGVGGDAPTRAVGRVAGGGMGSISVQLQNDYPRGSAQWFQQTIYGSDFWQRTAVYRTAMYVPAPGCGGWGGPWGGGMLGRLF